MNIEKKENEVNKEEYNARVLVTLSGPGKFRFVDAFGKVRAEP